MYSIKTRVRYTEIDEQRKLTLFGIINYFQDCSTFHSEDLGVGMEFLEQRNLAWWLLNWQIDILRRPVLGEEIEVGTFAYDFKTFFGMRNFFIKDSDGNVICRADSKWIHMDLAKQRPTKADANAIALYLNHNHPRFAMYELLSCGEEFLKPVFVKRMVVTRFILDTYRHVNNARYVDIALEGIYDYLSELSCDAFSEVVSLKAEYKRAATLGDELIIKIHASENGFAVHIDGDEQNFAKITVYTKV